MEMAMKIISASQTVLLRNAGAAGLENLIRLKFCVERAAPFSIEAAGKAAFTGHAEAGDNLAELWIPEPRISYKLSLHITIEDDTSVCEIALAPVKHWKVHFLQWSHHDTGYTDLPSRVFEEHCRWYDDVLEQLDTAQNADPDCRPRIVVEQFWSLDEYLRRASLEKREKMLDYIKRGDLELTALYGNLISEQLGHEECIRALYPAQELASKLGVKITAAAHNDIPGVAWGICRALCDAGIKYFVPDFPNYYDWGGHGLCSFWDDTKIWDYKGPGAFYWEAQDGRRVMLWNGRFMDGNTISGDFEWLEDCLSELSAYPYDVIRLQGKGGSTDNSRYRAEYAKGAAEWNAKYAFPHITISTNTAFFDAFEAEMASKGITLPVIRGELPGQDYPLAAMSMAQITTTARETHAHLQAAEKLLTIAKDDPQLKISKSRIDECFRDLLLADDHAYGHHFPAGPAMRASHWEKGVHAMRCEANTHDIMNKAMASITDRISADGSDFRLVVFNMSGLGGNFPVATPLRMLDNCNTQTMPGNREPGIFKGYILNNRRHTALDGDFIEGRFEILDMVTGKNVPYQLDEASYEDTEAYAPERDGLGQGTRRYGFFEEPGGLRLTIRFVAENMQPYSYRAYKLVKCSTAKEMTQCVEGASEISNGRYTIGAGADGITSIVDNNDGLELIDKDCPFGFGRILIRNGNQAVPEQAEPVRVRTLHGTVCDAVEIDYYHKNVPQIRLRAALWSGVDSIDLSVRILKDSKPLQTVQLALPFAGCGIRYQSTLNDVEPVTDFMPGSQSDTLTVQDWVQAKGTDILLSSTHVSAMSLGGFHPGYVLPAHRCIADLSKHIPLTKADYEKGWMLPVLSANNFGTNFMCSQVFEGRYTFHITRNIHADDSWRAVWGEGMCLGMQTMLTDRSRGDLPVHAQLLNSGKLQMLAFKCAEDGSGTVVRLWNHSDAAVQPQLICNGKKCRLIPLDALERPIESALELASRAVGCYKVIEKE